MILDFYRYEESVIGYDQDEKYGELFHPESRFLILRRHSDDLTPNSVELTPPLAFSMFRFDTEHTSNFTFAEVLYWYV